MTSHTTLSVEMVERSMRTNTLPQLYDQEVNNLIRLRYSQSKENAIHRHKLNGTGDIEFAELDAYCEECKKVAKATIERLKAMIPTAANQTSQLLDEEEDF